jgi:hypothetical protein
MLRRRVALSWGKKTAEGERGLTKGRYRKEPDGLGSGDEAAGVPPAACLRDPSVIKPVR